MSHRTGKPPLRLIVSCLAYSIAMWCLLFVPRVIVSYPVVFIRLLRGWQGYDGPFGNRMYGRYGNKAYPAANIWRSWVFLTVRNPISNFGKDVLAAYINQNAPADIWGFTGATDGPPGVEGWYFIHHPSANTEFGTWEYRLVKRLWRNRCLEIRMGWKLKGHLTGSNMAERCTYVCRINPFRKFG